MSGFYCQECSHHFRTIKAAEKASFGADGCPTCGGSDIDMGKPLPLDPKYHQAMAKIGTTVARTETGMMVARTETGTMVAKQIKCCKPDTGESIPEFTVSGKPPESAF